MAYVPANDSALVAPVKGSSAVWPLLISNDEACFEEYSPGLEVGTNPTATALAREFRWRVYGNLDNNSLVVGVRGIGVSGPHTVTIATPGVDSDTVSVGADAWYSATLQAAGPQQEVIVSSALLGGGTLSYSGLRHHHAPGLVVAGTPYPSRFRLISSQWGTSGYPVPSEVQGRLGRNPRFLAIDRPVCVAAHISDTQKAVAAKSADVWGAYNTADWSGVGRLKLPAADTVERLYRVDAYANETTPGTAEYAVRIGTRSEQWSGAGWHSWQIRARGAQEIIASCAPGISNGAAIRTLTVWRTEL